MEHELIISQDKSKLWINANDGSCIARFNKLSGIDIHNSI